MAYKFQLGAAVLSGSIKADDGLVGTDVDDATAANIVAQIDNKEIPHTKVALESGDILIGDGSGVAQNQTISGDATLAAGGALTIANNAVSLAKLAGLAAGRFILGDSNGDPAAVELSGDATVSAAGAITIAANAVEGSMINSNAAGDALAYSSNALNVQVSGALKIAGDKIGISGSFAGPGLVALGGIDSIEGIDLDIHGLPALGGTGIHQTQDFIGFSDNGESKKISFSNLEDAIFANVSSDATVAAGGALTIAADAVTYAKIQNVSATNVILGRDSAGAGVIEEIAPAALRTMINVEDGSTADQTAVEIIGALNSDLGGNFSIGNQSSDSLTLAGALIVGGDLTVQGTTTSVNSTTINISSSFTFEGPADAHETTLAVGIPTQDLQVNLPQFSASAGAATYHLPVLADATTAAAAAVTAAEFALLDGGSTIGTSALNKDDGFMHNDNGTMKHTKIEKLGDFLAGSALASVSGQLALDIGGLTAYETTIAQTDEFVFDDAGTLKKVQFTHLEDSVFASVSGDATVAAGGALTISAGAVEGSMLNTNAISGQSSALTSGLADTDEFLISDAGTLKRMDASVLKSYVAADVQDVAVKAAGGTLAPGVNYFEDMSSDGEDAVTLPGSPVVGQSVKVKAPSDCSEARYITINRAGSQTIDGATSIRLESPFAAVELIYVASNLWRVF
jgi:hypothetical protein